MNLTLSVPVLSLRASRFLYCSIWMIAVTSTNAQATGSLEVNCAGKGTLLGLKTTDPNEGSITFDSRALSGPTLTKALSYRAREARLALCKEVDDCLGSLQSPGNSGDARALESLVSDAGEILSNVVFQDNEQRTLANLKLKVQSADTSQSQEATKLLERILRVCRDRQDQRKDGVSRKAVSGKQESKELEIDYQLKGINRNKRGRYSSARIRAVVEHALLQGVDPFMALSIVLLENPPQVSESIDKYEATFGRIPVDAIGTIDMMGCGTKTLSDFKGAEAARLQRLASQIRHTSAQKPVLWEQREVVRKSIETAADGKKFDWSEMVESLNIPQGQPGPNETKQIQMAAKYQSAIQQARQSIRDSNLQLDELRHKKSQKSGTIKVAQLNIEEAELLEQVSAASERVKTLEKEASELPKVADSKALDASLRKHAQSKSRDLKKLQDLDRRLQDLENLGSTLAGGNQTNIPPNLAKAFACAQSPGCYGIIEQRVQRPEIDLRKLDRSVGVSRSTLMCTTGGWELNAGEQPRVFQSEALQQGVEGNPKDLSKDSCCVPVKHQMQDEKQLAIEFKSALGARFIRDTIQGCASTAPLDSCIQRFNGLGCFGCTEKMQNNCYDGIVGRDRPVYGARAADLMVNSLMVNSAIQKIVAEESSRLGRVPQSVFCKVGGTRNIDRDEYLNAQRRYLLLGADGKYQARFGRQLREPASEAETEDFKSREALRVEACSKFFE